MNELEKDTALQNTYDVKIKVGTPAQGGEVTVYMSQQTFDAEILKTSDSLFHKAVKAVKGMQLGMGKGV